MTPVPEATDAFAEIEPPDAERYREVVGQFATGVAIITGVTAQGQPVGFACQSFTSVSLVPPMVLFCADHRGWSWPRLRGAGVFCANVVGRASEDLVDRFGRPTGARFDGLDWRVGPVGAPSIDEAIARIHCRINEVHVAGDHDVVIAEVLAVEDGGDDTEEPIIYHRGQFTALERHGHPEHGHPDDVWG